MRLERHVYENWEQYAFPLAFAEDSASGHAFALFRNPAPADEVLISDLGMPALVPLSEFTNDVHVSLVHWANFGLDTCEAGTVRTAKATETMPIECAPCSAGTFCPGGDVGEIACAEGTWDDDGDPATACVAE